MSSPLVPHFPILWSLNFHDQFLLTLSAGSPQLTLSVREGTVILTTLKLSFQQFLEISWFCLVSPQIHSSCLLLTLRRAML